MKLTVKTVGEPRRDHVVVRIEFSNNTSIPVGWDREFAAFLRWECGDETGTYLEPVRVKEVARPKDQESAARFRKIAPGEKCFRDLELTRAFPVFLYGYGTVGKGHESRHVAVAGYELQCRFNIPVSAAEVRIRAEYAIEMGGIVAFQKWFNHDADQLGLPTKRLRSNEIKVQFH